MITEVSENVRIRWIHDDDYETRGSFAYDTDEETKRAEDHEIERLESGFYEALIALVEVRCDRCGKWEATDTLCGIVIEPTDKALTEFAQHSLEIPSEEDARVWFPTC